MLATRVKATVVLAASLALFLALVGWYIAPGSLEHMHGSPSRLGDTTGKLMDNDHLSKICDRTRNGIRDRQSVFRGRGFNRHHVDEIRDRNGTKPGCSYKRYGRNMSAHQVSSLRGGTFSVH
jgi:hypothetical protein